MLYLVDKPMAEIAFRTAEDDDDARIILIQDGVLIQPELDVPTYAVEKDVEIRGVDLPPDVECISYDKVIELVLEQETKNFV
jgi:tRNA 2-thiouridine synthesizing protein B